MGKAEVGGDDLLCPRIPATVRVMAGVMHLAHLGQ